MDRLYPLIAAVFVICIGCDPKPGAESTQPKSSAPSRVNAVQAQATTAESPDDFCDVYKPAGTEAQKFAYPELDGTAPPEKDGWRWINIWATWCVPCIEEMPRLQKWKTEMAPKGLGDVVFISADNDAETLAKFAGKHPDLPGVTGPRIAEVSNLTPWVEGLGLQGAALPVHIFVDPDDNIRCLRAGGVGESDRATVESLLGS